MMGRFAYRRVGINKNENTEVNKCLREHGVKGIEAFRQQFNVECFEDITPTTYFDKNEK